MTHRLILPADSNHHGTLYAGSLMSLALEAGYSSAYRAIGVEANLVLKRVLDLRCDVPVPVGTVTQIRGRPVTWSRAQVVIALVGTPIAGTSRPWLEALMQFVQVDEQGRPTPFRSTGELGRIDDNGQIAAGGPPWGQLQARARKTLAIRR